MYVRKWLFPSMLGVSVVCHENSAGNELGLFEVTVLVKSPNGEGYVHYLNLDNCCFTAVGLIVRDVRMIDEVYFDGPDFGRRAMRILKDNEKHWQKIHKDSLKDKAEQRINQCAVPTTPIDR
jgi:hypothetical protein